ncbi:MAG: restriction endonuclease [Pyrinomonadaceae bacterium]
MSIWNYADSLPGPSYFFDVINVQECPYCKLKTEKFRPPAGKRGWDLELDLCRMCGWWNLIASYLDPIEPGEPVFYKNVYSQACLRNLDERDVDLPLEEIRTALLLKQEKFGSVTPRMVERLVADVFSNLGHRVELTAHSGDEGIDVYLLRDPEDSPVAVQVKRYKRNVDVSQIRSFLGALPLKGITQGIFVTTSDFTSGAREFSEALKKAQLARIELLNGTWLLEALRITQRSEYQGWNDPSAPFWDLLVNPELIIWGHSGYTI